MNIKAEALVVKTLVKGLAEVEEIMMMAIDLQVEDANAQVKVAEVNKEQKVPSTAERMTATVNQKITYSNENWNDECH